MKRQIKHTISLIALLSLFSCSSSEPVYNNNLDCSSHYIIKDGEQTVQIYFSDSDQYEATTFAEDISAEDITLSDCLTGKEVTSLTYIDETTIEITLDGDCSSYDGDARYGVITVSNDAVADGNYAYCNVYVTDPGMMLDSASIDGDTYSSSFSVLGGEASSNISDYISLEGNYGTLSVTLYDDLSGFTVLVEDFDTTDTNYPIVNIAEGATTLSTAFTIYVGYSNNTFFLAD